MAYDFSQIDNAMSGQNNSNIFGQDGASGGSGTNQQPAAGGNMGAAAGPSQASAAQPKQQTAKQPANVGATVVKKNKTPEAGANFISGIQNQAATTKQNLQNEANQYVQGAQTKAQSYNVDQGQLDKAIGGDAEALSKSASRLSQQQADALDPYQQKVNPQIGDISKIGNDAGLQQFLKQRGGETYTGGMAALDQMLLSKDKNFQKQREGLAGTQAQLMDEAKKSRTSAEQQAKDINEKAFSESTGKAKDYLGSRAAAEDAREAQEIAQERAAREQLRQQAASGQNAYLTQQQQKTRQGLEESAKAFSPGLLQHLQKSKVSANPYYKVNDVAEGASIDQDEAARMNRIQSLLGTGKSYQAGGGFGDRESFDSNAYQAALTKIANEDYGIQGLNDADDAAYAAQQAGGGINRPGTINLPFNEARKGTRRYSYSDPAQQQAMAPIAINQAANPYAGIDGMFNPGNIAINTRL